MLAKIRVLISFCPTKADIHCIAQQGNAVWKDFKILNLDSYWRAMWKLFQSHGAFLKKDGYTHAKSFPSYFLTNISNSGSPKKGCPERNLLKSKGFQDYHLPPSSKIILVVALHLKQLNSIPYKEEMAMHSSILAQKNPMERSLAGYSPRSLRTWLSTQTGLLGGSKGWYLKH